MKPMTFRQYISFYPKIELPIRLIEELVLEFSGKNKPLPPVAIAEFIEPHEKEIDELTEFIPCFSIPNTEKYKAIVYWKGALLLHEFVLVTYDLKGNFICKRALSSMIIDGDHVKQSVAEITEDLVINIVAGHNEGQDLDYDPQLSKVYRLQLQEDGQVLFSDES